MIISHFDFFSDVSVHRFTISNWGIKNYLITIDFAFNILFNGSYRLLVPSMTEKQFYKENMLGQFTQPREEDLQSYYSIGAYLSGSFNLSSV